MYNIIVSVAYFITKTILIKKKIRFYYSILEVLVVILPILMTVAFVTIAERKIMAAMQRRCGPNAVGV
jgi:NADH:ubiquinone oxidoreductase subunit H